MEEDGTEQHQPAGKRKFDPSSPSKGVRLPLQGIPLSSSPERSKRRKGEPEGSEYLKYEGTPVELGDVVEHFLSACIGREELGLSPKVDLQRLYYEALTVGDFARMVGGVVVPVTDIRERHAMFQRDIGEPTEGNVCTALSRSKALRDNPSLFKRNLFATLPSELQTLIVSLASMGSPPTRMAVPLVSRSWSGFSESRQGEIVGVYADLLPEILMALGGPNHRWRPKMKFRTKTGWFEAGLVMFAHPAVPEGCDATPDRPYLIKRKPLDSCAPTAEWNAEGTVNVPLGPDRPSLPVPRSGAHTRESAAALLDWWMGIGPHAYILLAHWDHVAMEDLARSLPGGLLEFIFVEPGMSERRLFYLRSAGWKGIMQECGGDHIRIPTRGQWVRGVNDRPELLRMAESWLSARLVVEPSRAG